MTDHAKISRLLDRIDKFIDAMSGQADEIEGCGAGCMADDMQIAINDAKLTVSQLRTALPGASE